MHKLDKARLVADLKQFEANCYAIVYDGLVHQLSRHKIIVKIKQEVGFIVKKYYISKDNASILTKAALDFYYRAYKLTLKQLKSLRMAKNGLKTYSAIIEEASKVVYQVVEDEVRSDRIVKKAINKVANDEELANKLDILHGMLSNRSGFQSPFYLCTANTNPAADHAPYQGKIYYDEGWKNYILDQNDIVRIEAYIKNHKLKSLQWVIGAPVYMYTRPNCRHEFVRVGIEEVLTSSAASLLKKHNLLINMDAIKPKNKVLEAYKDVYNIHLMLWNMIPNKILGDQLNLDRKMLKKHSK